MMRFGWALLLAGCGSSVTPGGAVPGEAMEALAIVDLEGDAIGETVQAVFGPQGGYHMDLGARVVAPSADVALEIDVTRSVDGVRIGGTLAPAYIALVGWDEAAGEGWASTRAFLDLPCEVDGEQLLVEVTTCGLPDGDPCASIEGEIIAEIPPGGC